MLYRVCKFHVIDRFASTRQRINPDKRAGDTIAHCKEEQRRPGIIENQCYQQRNHQYGQMGFSSQCKVLQAAVADPAYHQKRKKKHGDHHDV